MRKGCRERQRIPDYHDETADPSDAKNRGETVARHHLVRVSVSSILEQRVV